MLLEVDAAMQFRNTIVLNALHFRRESGLRFIHQKSIAAVVLVGLSQIVRHGKN
jgi:hypothetical protein